MRVHVYLRSSLFSLPGARRHVPDQAMVLVGQLKEQAGGGITVDVESFLDERGRALEGAPRTLIIPGSKIDHLWVEPS